MKKNLLVASVISLAMIMSSGIAMADNTVKAQKDTKAVKECPKKCDKSGAFKGKERPKFYDKDGNELKAPPKPGTKIYDKNGKEIDFKKMKKRHPKGPELNLTEEQKAQADKFREESKSKMKPIFEEMKSLNEKIGAIYEDDKMTQKEKEKQLKPLMEKSTKLHLQANEIRKADMKKFEAILTDEQKTKLEEFKKTHQERKKGQMGGKMMPPKPQEQK